MQQVIIYLGLPKTKSTFLAKKFEKKNFQIISCPIVNSYNEAFKKIMGSNENFFLKCEDLYIDGAKNILKNYKMINNKLSKIKNSNITIYYNLRPLPEHICSFYSEIHNRLRNKNKIFRNFSNIRNFFTQEQKNKEIKNIIDIFDHKKNIKNIEKIFNLYQIKKLTLNRNAKNKIMTNQVKGNYFRKDFGKIYNILKVEFYFLKNFIPPKVIIFFDKLIIGDKIFFTKSEILKINKYFKKF